MPSWYIAGNERFRGPAFPAAAGAYQGPGDVVSGAIFWGGLRGYNAAYTGHAVDLVDQAGANPITIGILSGGNLDIASINAWVTAHSVSTILITKLYDQSGNGNHASQATVAHMPTLSLNVIGALPSMLFAGLAGVFQAVTSTTPTQALPITVSAVINGNNASGSNIEILSSQSATDCEFGLDTTPHAFIYSGTTQTNVTTTYNVFHALQFMNTGSAAASITIDGTNTSPGTNPGTNALTGISIGSFQGIATFGFSGNISEVGVWASTFTIGGGQQDQLMNTNQHNYWGF